MNALSGNLNSFVGGSGGSSAGAGNSSSPYNLWSRSGLNANNSAYGVGGANPFVNAASYMQSGLLGGMAQANQYGNSLESQREGLMNSILGQLSQGGINSAAARTQNGIMQNASRSGQQAAMSLQGMGYGDGVSGGALAGSMNQGLTQANAATQQYNNPSYVASVLGQGIGAIGQGMQNPLAAQAAGYEPYIMQQNQTNYQQQGQGLLGMLAPIAGQYFGGSAGSSLLGGLFGGGGQGSVPSGGSYAYSPMPGAYGGSIPYGYTGGLGYGG